MTRSLKPPTRLDSNAVSTDHKSRLATDTQETKGSTNSARSDDYGKRRKVVAMTGRTHEIVSQKETPAKMVRVPGYTDDTFDCGCVFRRPARQWKNVCADHINGIDGIKANHGWGCQCSSCVSAVVG